MAHATTISALCAESQILHKIVFQHHGCRERADDTYALELPEQCATLGSEARPYAYLDSVAENKEGFAKKQWGAPVVRALDAWEQVT